MPGFFNLKIKDGIEVSRAICKAERNPKLTDVRFGGSEDKARRVADPNRGRATSERPREGRRYSVPAHQIKKPGTDAWLF